jgi:hypothetical protein
MSGPRALHQRHGELGRSEQPILATGNFPVEWRGSSAGRISMKKLVLVAVISAFACGSAFAQSCESKAVSKDGKALAGAAKVSSIKKCCEDSAMGKDGKALAGAAKTSYLKKCESGG